MPSDDNKLDNPNSQVNLHEPITVDAMRISLQILAKGEIICSERVSAGTYTGMNDHFTIVVEAIISSSVISYTNLAAANVGINSDAEDIHSIAISGGILSSRDG